MKNMDSKLTFSSYIFSEGSDDTGTTTVVSITGTAGQDAGDLRETGCYREVCLPAEGEEVTGG